MARSMAAARASDWLIGQLHDAMKTQGLPIFLLCILSMLAMTLHMQGASHADWIPFIGGRGATSLFMSKENLP